MTYENNHNEKEIAKKVILPLGALVKLGQQMHGVCQMIDCSLDLDPSMPFLSLGDGLRESKKQYIKHELDWYKSQDLCINGHEGITQNRIWRSCATGKGYVNSNYGYLVYNDENFAQFDHAIREMVKDPFTRRAAMIYNRPSIVEEQNDGVHANRDFICTYATSFLLDYSRDLHMQVHMRSNDFTYGFFNDFAWQCYVYQDFKETLKERGVRTNNGTIHWHADSMHVYERDFELMIKLYDYYNERYLR